MSYALDQVNKVKTLFAQAESELAKLPAELRSLVGQEKSWAAKHPVWNAAALLGIGAAMALLAVWGFAG